MYSPVRERNNLGLHARTQKSEHACGICFLALRALGWIEIRLYTAY